MHEHNEVEGIVHTLCSSFIETLIPEARLRNNPQAVAIATLMALEYLAYTTVGSMTTATGAMIAQYRIADMANKMAEYVRLISIMESIGLRLEDMREAALKGESL
jgi:hypothetical protein